MIFQTFLALMCIWLCVLVFFIAEAVCFCYRIVKAEKEQEKGGDCEI